MGPFLWPVRCWWQINGDKNTRMTQNNVILDRTTHVARSLLPVWDKRYYLLPIINIKTLLKRVSDLSFKGLASYCKAETTFPFHFSILILSNAFLSINNRGMKSESDFSLAMASQPFQLEELHNQTNETLILLNWSFSKHKSFQ